MGKCRRIPKSLSYIKEEDRRAGGGEGVRKRGIRNGENKKTNMRDKGEGWMWRRVKGAASWFRIC